MRLCKLFVAHQRTVHADAHALMSLMCLHASRFESRLDEDHNIVLLKDQDRNLWHPELIRIGLYHLTTAFRMGRPSSYHWEAMITSEHIQSTSFESTNWGKILIYYKNLYTLKPTDQILLNQVIVCLQIKDLKQALAIYVRVNEHPTNLKLYHFVGVELAVQEENVKQALHHLDQVESASPTRSELQLLNKKRERIQLLRQKSC